jgi:hypothetical protein
MVCCTSFVSFSCLIASIHHAALIKAIAIEMDLKLPVEFGVAPATARYRKAKL